MNPATILSFIAIFAGLGLGTTQPDLRHAILLVSGITIGSAVWWLILKCLMVLITSHQKYGKIDLLSHTYDSF